MSNKRHAKKGNGGTIIGIMIAIIILCLITLGYIIITKMDLVNTLKQESKDTTIVEATPEPTVEPTIEPTIEPTNEPIEALEEDPEDSSEMEYTLENYYIDYEQLDDELLVLVSPLVALPDDYEITLVSYDNKEVNELAYDQLSDLLKYVNENIGSLWIASGYRSVELQDTLFNRYVDDNMDDGMTYEEAVADVMLTATVPGYSEHHTGLAVDFNYVTEDFQYTDQYEWLCEHAHEYGFILRYTEEKEDITNINYEPWHYRYVGVEHATAMYEMDMCLEEYIIYLKNQ